MLIVYCFYHHKTVFIVYTSIYIYGLCRYMGFVYSSYSPFCFALRLLFSLQLHPSFDSPPQPVSSCYRQRRPFYWIRRRSALGSSQNGAANGAHWKASLRRNNSFAAAVFSSSLLRLISLRGCHHFFIRAAFFGCLFSRLFLSLITRIQHALAGLSTLYH